MKNRNETTGLHSVVAGLLVFLSAASVLVLEILGARLLAPYIGVNLQTYTSMIGTVLTGISLGTWVGGGLADRVSPRLLLGPLLFVGGTLVLFVNPVIHVMAQGAQEPGPVTVIAIAFGALFLPALVLSAVNPTVVKLQLLDLRHTGSVVGRLSALATAGAVSGTFATGFLLVGTFRMSRILDVTGLSLCAMGVVLVMSMPIRKWKAKKVSVSVLALAFLGFSLNQAEPRVCDKETRYFCIRAVSDRENPSGRTLVLDNLDHSYVDLADPTNLNFWYIKTSAAVVDAAFAGEQPFDMLSIGGGGFTLPRYFDATRPGTRSTVFELDPGVVEFNRTALHLGSVRNLKVRNVDARVGIRTLPSASQDVVIGDAFASESVPWHLTTQEFFRQLRRVMRPDGIFVMNLIDFSPNHLLKAEVATLRTVFAYVVVLRQQQPGVGVLDGNNVVVATNRTLDPLTVDDTVSLRGASLQQFIGSRRTILRDDFAPADQLITTLAEAEKHL